MRKLGKKKILSLLTAVAIVATTVGSFAVWDKIQDTKTASVPINRPIQTTVSDFSIGASGTESGDSMVYTGSTKVDVANVPAGKDLKLTAVLADDSTEKTGVTVGIAKEAADATTGSYTDTGIASGEHTYSVKVSADRADAANWTSNNEVKVTVTAELVDTPAAP